MGKKKNLTDSFLIVSFAYSSRVHSSIFEMCKKVMYDPPYIVRVRSRDRHVETRSVLHRSLLWDTFFFFVCLHNFGFILHIFFYGL